MDVRANLAFVAALVVGGPVLAVAGVSAGGAWAAAGVAAAGVLVAATAARAFLGLKRSGSQVPVVLRARMMALTATVAVVAGALTIGAVVWLLAGALG